LSEDAYSFLEASSDVVYCMVSPEGIVLRASRALRAMVGEQDPVGRSFADLQPESSVQTPGAQPEPTRYTFRDVRAGITTMFLVAREVAGGTVLVGSKWQVTHSEALNMMSKLKNEMSALNRELQKKNSELEQAQQEIKTLSGMLPICSHCKSIRDEVGYWTRVEEYLSKHSEVTFSHGICEPCLAKHYPEFRRKKESP
jgi:hypothetical protein